MNTWSNLNQDNNNYWIYPEDKNIVDFQSIKTIKGYLQSITESNDLVLLNNTTEKSIISNIDITENITINVNNYKLKSNIIISSETFINYSDFIKKLRSINQAAGIFIEGYKDINSSTIYLVKVSIYD